MLGLWPNLQFVQKMFTGKNPISVHVTMKGYDHPEVTNLFSKVIVSARTVIH